MTPLLRFFLFLLTIAGAASAGPGAHGPGGEHLDAPGGSGHAAQGAPPRMEARSEAFELVARLAGDELSILVDRFETNEPVLRAQLDVESRGRKARAKFHEDHGDYAVDDAEFVKALSAPGEHPLVFTLVAGNESDLLEGVIAVPAAAAPHDDPLSWKAWAAIAGGILAAAAVAFTLRRRQSAAVAAVAVVLLSGASLAIAGPGAHGPGGEHLDEAAGVTAAAGLARLPDGSLNVPKLAQRRMEIRTVLAPETETAATVEMPGRVVMDPNAGGRVQSAHGGRLEAGPGGLPVAGKAVRKGEVLAYVRHHAEPFAVAGQRSQLAEIRAAREIAERKARRLEGLEGTVPRKEIEAARAELASLESRQREIGGSLEAREALVAPIAGVIARADAVAGQIVEAGALLYEIVDPGRVLVEAATADVALANSLGTAGVREASGVRLEKVGVARSLREGMLPVTFRARSEKPGGALPLAIGQPVTVVAALQDKRKGIVLPAASVVRGASNEPTVFIKVGAERFMPQAVETRPVDAVTVVVVKGLAADNRVVVQGASLLAQIR